MGTGCGEYVGKREHVRFRPSWVYHQHTPLAAAYVGVVTYALLRVIGGRLDVHYILGIF